MRSLIEYIDESLKDQEKMFAKEFQKQKEEAAKSNSKDLDRAFVLTLQRVIRNGYFVNEFNPIIKYGVSEENFYEVVDENEVSKEQLKKIIDELKTKDPWRFHKNAEYRSKGYQDPPANLEEMKAQAEQAKKAKPKGETDSCEHKKIKTTNPKKLFENFKEIIEKIQNYEFSDQIQGLKIELSGQGEGGISTCEFADTNNIEYVYIYNKENKNKAIDVKKLTLVQDNNIKYDGKYIRGTNQGFVKMTPDCIDELYLDFDCKSPKSYLKEVTGNRDGWISLTAVIDTPDEILDYLNKAK